MALTAAQIERREALREYWRKREREQRELYLLEEEEQQRRINQIYSGMEAWCTQEIEAFYGRYATAEGIDITEAKKRVSQADIEQFETLAKQYVKDRDFSDEANQAMRLYNATMKINRLELLKAQIGLHMVGGTDEIAKYYEETITNRTMDELERQSGILGKPLKEEDALKKAKNIVNASFYNATFSERIWSHCDNLRNEIGIELQKGLIAGVGSRQMAANLRKKYQASASDAHRLMVTELRRVQTDVALDSYKENGIEEFEFLAVNPRACEICKEMDGKVFPVSELEAGVNAPPIHPRCHCTTAPHMDEDEYNAWLDNLAGDAPTATPTQTEAQEPEDTPFTPAKTKAEAEEYGRQFADDVDYSGISLSNANTINEQLSILTKKYKINRLSELGQHSKKGVMSANFHWLHVNGKKLGKTLDDDEFNFKLNQAMDKSSIKIMEERWAGKNMPPKIQRDLERLKNKQRFERWGVHSLSEDHVKWVVTHEYGHILSDQYFGMINQETANPNYLTDWRLRDMDRRWEEALQKARESGDIYGISQYANSNSHEFFAECFAYREMGYPLPDYVETLMVEVLDNGIM